ncbi:MAG: hypothetical protein Q7T11_05065, partial [Deltaproteobacteria bacterium]|nr:hypothetical protein [Deltaproteobacteria bacterium]
YLDLVISHLSRLCGLCEIPTMIAPGKKTDIFSSLNALRNAFLVQSIKWGSQAHFGPKILAFNPVDTFLRKHPPAGDPCWYFIGGEEMLPVLARLRSLIDRGVLPLDFRILTETNQNGFRRREETLRTFQPGVILAMRQSSSDVEAQLRAAADPNLASRLVILEGNLEEPLGDTLRFTARSRSALETVAHGLSPASATIARPPLGLPSMELTMGSDVKKTETSLPAPNSQTGPFSGLWKRWGRLLGHRLGERAGIPPRTR